MKASVRELKGNLFNNRKTDDGARFVGAMEGFAGKRLTYKQLTGKEGVSAQAAP